MKTEAKLNALIEAVKDNLSGKVVCDSMFRCEGWETFPGNESDRFCMHCGRERTWRDKPATSPGTPKYYATASSTKNPEVE
ncbi:MAG: hypothetical protein Q7J27_00510 [Syntrophales bacterium]|nr:hypothetical protein [Syntrophales bacterium]